MGRGPRPGPLPIIALGGTLLLLDCARFGYDELLPRDDGPTVSPGGGASNVPDPSLGGAGTLADGGMPPAGGSGGRGGSNGGGGGSGGGSSSGGVASRDAGPIEPVGSCSDGLLGAGETAIDCGGTACAPCPCAFGTPEVLGDPNYPGNQLYSPSLSADGLTLWFGFITPGFAEQIGVAERTDPNGAFSLGNVAGPPLSVAIDGTPQLSLDGRSMYFYSERPNGAGLQDLYLATRARPTDAFTSASQLTTLATPQLEHLPWPSADELTLYFASDRGGNRDIWRSTRARITDAFGAPSPVTELNTPSDDGGITLTADGLVAILASDRLGSSGGKDFYQAFRASTDAPFSTPVRIPELSSDVSDYDPKFTMDGATLYFASLRGGSDSRLWRAARLCP